MRIGIDVSQLAYPNTGVAIFLQNLLEKLFANDLKNEYVLFYSSLRRPVPQLLFALQKESKNISVKSFKFPPSLLHIIWNMVHFLPIESLIGPVDVFISSDWTQPPSKAKKLTILYDLIVYKYPEETAEKIVAVQRSRLEWVRKEVDKIICISRATKKDAMEILKIPENRLSVIYPGI